MSGAPDKNRFEKLAYQNGQKNNSMQTNNNCNNNSEYDSSMKNDCGQNGNNNKQNLSICHDFAVKRRCNREYCRFPHVFSTDQVTFCHDFQNSGCPRQNCNSNNFRYLHYSIEEEEHYRRYGEFPPLREPQGPIYPQPPPPPPPPQQQQPPPQFENIRRFDNRFQQQHGPPPPPPPYQQNQWIHPDEQNFGPPPPVSQPPPPPPISHYAGERRKYDGGNSDNILFKRFHSMNDEEQIDIYAMLKRMEVEQNMLRRRVEANEIKIAELKASNDYLIAQNAQFRLSSQVQVSRVVNSVTVTNSPAPQQQAQTQVISAVSMAPVHVAAPIVSISTPQTQLIATSNGPSLAIATNTNQGQLSLTPSQSLGPTQLLGTSQITLAPAAIQTATPMSLTINTSQALAISNASQPIISYPIMTHSILPH